MKLALDVLYLISCLLLMLFANLIIETLDFITFGLLDCYHVLACVLTSSNKDMYYMCVCIPMTLSDLERRYARVRIFFRGISVIMPVSLN